MLTTEKMGRGKVLEQLCSRKPSPRGVYKGEIILKREQCDRIPRKRILENYQWGFLEGAFSAPGRKQET